KEHKARGYGLFWIIVEMLHEDSDHHMSLSELTYISISAQSGEPVPYVQKFVDACISRYEVFIVEENRFTTSRVIRNIDRRLEISQQKSAAGKKGAEKKWQKIAGAIQVPDSAMADDGTSLAENGKVKESKEKKSKSYLRPKGLTAAFAADTDEVKVLKKEYDELVNGLDGSDTAACWTGIKTFFESRRPTFIEPFVDLWNIFALRQQIIANPIRITEKRRKKLATRLSEEGFDYIAILQAIKSSAFLKGKGDGGWRVSFEYIIDSEENYTKILEGKYN